MKGLKTKNRLIEIALDQTSVDGLNGVTLGQLAADSGLSKSGLFAHFRSKEQLQIEILDASARTADRIVREPAMAVTEGLPRLLAVMENWLGWSRRAGLHGGCPVAAAMFELDDSDGPVRDHAAKLEEYWRDQLQELVTAAKRLSHLAPDTDVEQFVWELFGIYLSHHVSSRFMRDPEARTRARTAIDALVARHLPPAD